MHKSMLTLSTVKSTLSGNGNFNTVKKPLHHSYALFNLYLFTRVQMKKKLTLPLSVWKEFIFSLLSIRGVFCFTFIKEI